MNKSEFEKLREFILADSCIDYVLYNGEKQEARVAVSKIKNATITGKYIHVIEYAAIDLMKAREDKLVEAIKETINNFERELDPFSGSYFDSIVYREKIEPLVKILADLGHEVSDDGKKKL